jgi:hypothetical protein
MSAPVGLADTATGDAQAATLQPLDESATSYGALPDDSSKGAPTAEYSVQIGDAAPQADGVSQSPAEAASAQPPLAADSAPPKLKAKKKPAPAPYKPVYYDNDFSYLDDPNYTGSPRLGESLKRLHCGDCWTVDLGGEYRLRQHSEDNFAQSRLLGLANDNNFLLQRTRLFANVQYGSLVRFYGEAIDAVSSWEDFAPRTIEENRFDALNLFVDGLLIDGDCGQLHGRAGRQELLYGAQRLISPLDWANTRRTFDGAKLMWKGEEWNVDGFWTRPVPFSQHVEFDHEFDHPDLSQEFMGIYSTRTSVKDRPLDLYYIRYAEYDGAPNFDTNTFGSRWQAKNGNWLVEIEGGYQFGEWGAGDHSAGFYTLGLGHQWGCCCWKPTVWLYYDWASGDDDPTDGTHHTFNHLFPLGHKYFGYMDLVGRQNIEDFNILATARPLERLELQIWWHIFHLDEPQDALYNAAGAAIRSDPTGAAGTDVGQELDVVLTWLARPNADVQFGYGHFFAGDFIGNTGPGNDADFYFTQFNLRF